MSYAIARHYGANSQMNKLHSNDRGIHEWYRFVLSFAPHLVRTYLERFDIDSRQTVLDPFCGTGTVLVECEKLGIRSIGIEPHPMARFASRAKVDWSNTPVALLRAANSVAEATLERFALMGTSDTPQTSANQLLCELRALPPQQSSLLLQGSISPLPLHKTLVLVECLSTLQGSPVYHHARLALAKALVTSVGNIRFRPEVTVGDRKPDSAVVAPWLDNVKSMAHDLEQVSRNTRALATVLDGDARRMMSSLAPRSIDAVITSPPYPNEKDYTRTTRLESVLLGLITDRAELRALKGTLLRSNTRNVYTGDNDHIWVRACKSVDEIANAIERRRQDLGKTSGFERLYASVARLYFGGMARHLATLRPALRRGARLAYVVGDQASYLQVMIHTGQVLAEIAESLGYRVTDLDLFRTRRASNTNSELREEVLLLEWPGYARTSKPNC